MSFRTKFLLVVTSASLALYALIGGWMATRAQQPINDAGTQLRIFDSVLQHIQNDYVDEPNLEKVDAGALRGLAYGLDPYSSYLTAQQVKDYQANKSKGEAGIGAEVSQVSSYLYVIAPVKGSPSEKAGLRNGDVIEYIENKATRDISLYDARQMLLGDAGTKVKLRVLRAGNKPQSIEVTRGTFKTPEVEARVDNNGAKVGVIKVNSLQEGEANDIKNRLTDLTKQGVTKIVLDLRGVAGGSLTEAVNVANLFIKEGVLAQTIGRENKVLQTFTADSSKAVFTGQVATLIDFGTAGAGEVVASAMLSRQRGDVIGEKSFGAGTEQKLFTLSRNGDGFLLTTTKWASADGKAFLDNDRQLAGVKPSIEVKRPELPEPIDPESLSNDEPQPDEATPTATPTPKPTPQPAQPEDVQLKKALEVLRKGAAVTS
ncbi:MAG: PDZ domain-containing protein [Pyrinomonadaceae bacterium]|nr:PDZ domain-containing protein [Pyrinomonadaceae bacterium]